FAKLDQRVLGDLLKPENKAALQTVLKHHIVVGAVDAGTVVGLTETRALGGQRLAIEVDDAGVRVGGATVVKTDIEASNGIVHVIDSVIVPNTDDVIDTAVANGSFGTLAKALGAAGLVEALKGEGPFTVFAPTDEAFAKLDQRVLGDLLKPENRDKLAAILKFHVVPGRISARAAVGAGVAETLQGQSVRIAITDGRLTVGGATVVASDVDATNGVIHVIDTVLLPQ
ncbi:MAG: fasciclin domain-containing protein, partial [Planctomycetota bacterium]